MRDIGNNIKDLRIRKQMTQDELAEMLFVTRQTVSNYETGKSRPDVDMLTAISQALGADVNEILYGPTAPAGRKAEYIRFAKAAGFCIALWILMVVLDDVTWDLYRNSFHIFPRALQYLILCPFAFFCTGYTSMQLLRLFTGLRPVKGKYVKWVRRGILAVLVGAFLFLLPHLISMVEGSVRYMIYKAQGTGGGFSYSGRVKVTDFHMFLFRILDHQPWILGLFGAALWLFHEPKNES